MRTLNIAAAPLLQARNASDFSNFGTDWSLELIIVSAVVILVLVVVIVVLAKRGSRDEPGSSGPAVGSEEIFARLCMANQLSKSESYLLRRMVYDLNLSNPLLPFVDPRLFDRYGEVLGGNKRALLTNIKGKLFS